jgi:uncharacterized protein YbjT (DUF2867 family)
MILLTGGTGFVGGHIAHELRAQERPVRCLVRPGTRAARLERLGCELVEGDVTDPESLRRALAGCDAVVHLVAIRQGRPEQFERVMTQATRDFVTAAREAGVRRFVLMSALGFTEETKDLVPYYRAKWEQEQALQASGLEHVIFRPSFVFGPDGGILSFFKNLARVAPATPIVGSGEQRIQPIWCADLAAYFAAAIDHPDAADRTFELGGPDVVDWNEFWERLRGALGIRRRPTIHVPLALMRVNATLTELLPGNFPLTRDLLKMLQGPDNVVSNDDAVRTFELPLVPLDEQLRRSV